MCIEPFTFVEFNFRVLFFKILKNMWLYVFNIFDTCLIFIVIYSTYRKKQSRGAHINFIYFSSLT
jgi:hypothetical protein